jgi:chitinase
VMTYDMHGAWDAGGPTNFQDPLYDAPDDPSTPIPPGSAQYNIDGAVKAWTTGDPAYGIPGGFPANKLTIGYPFYYRGWRGVPDGGRSGLYQSATGGATGHPNSGNVAGVSFYKELLGFVDNPAYTHFDDTTKATWFYNGDTFWTGDNAQSIKAKADYAHCKGLAGAMMYSLEALDAGATLFNHVVDAVNADTPDCSNPNPTPSTPNPSTPNPSTPNPTPSQPPTSTPPTGTAWTAWTAYSAGARVTYNGAEYQCIQGHTSQPGWEPANVPALWRAL